MAGEGANHTERTGPAGRANSFHTAASVSTRYPKPHSTSMHPGTAIGPGGYLRTSCLCIRAPRRTIMRLPTPAEPLFTRATSNRQAVYCLRSGIHQSYRRVFLTHLLQVLLLTASPRALRRGGDVLPAPGCTLPTASAPTSCPTGRRQASRPKPTRSCLLGPRPAPVIPFRSPLPLIAARPCHRMVMCTAPLPL